MPSKKYKTKRNCPFCGFLSTHVLTPTSQPQTSAHGKGYQVECLNCGARGPCGYISAKDASLAWDHGEGGCARITQESRGG